MRVASYSHVAGSRETHRRSGGAPRLPTKTPSKSKLSHANPSNVSYFRPSGKYFLKPGQSELGTAIWFSAYH